MSIKLPSASATKDGIVENAAQTFAGDKTFNNNVSVLGTMTSNIVVSQSTASPSGTVTVGTTDPSLQILTPSVDITLTLNNTHVAGRIITVVNLSTMANNKVIQVKANDGSIIRTVYASTSAQIACITNSPGTSAGWYGIGMVSSNWKTQSPTWSNVTFGTAQQQNSRWRRMGDSVEFEASFYNGTTGGNVTGTIGLNLPTVPVAGLLVGGPAASDPTVNGESQTIGIARLGNSTSKQYTGVAQIAGSGTSLITFTGTYNDGTACTATSSQWNATIPVNLATSNVVVSTKIAMSINGWTTNGG